MVDLASVAAFTGPIILAMVGSVGWFSYVSNKRERYITGEIEKVTGKLDTRIQQVETSQAATNRQVERMNDTLTTALQGLARIEGRLSGQQGTSAVP